jgi:thioredoxin reductase (NADPH)
LLNLWNDALEKNQLSIQENSKVEKIIQKEGFFEIETLKGETISTKNILLAIGRRGTPRKLGVPGEMQEKVAYRLLEPEVISGKEIIVVGGGDSAIESALLLADQNNVILSYRSDAFNRIKPKNSERILDAAANGKVKLWFNTNVLDIGATEIVLNNSVSGEQMTVKNDLIYIFAGGELPTQFLMKAGIQITKKFGEAILKH